MSSDVSFPARLKSLQDELKREKRKNTTWNRAYETLKADFDRLTETNRTTNVASAMDQSIVVADPVDSTMPLGDVPERMARAVKSEPADETSAHRSITWIADAIELERVQTTSATMIECKNREILRQRGKVSSLEQENRVLKETVHNMVGDHVKVKQFGEENEILKRELTRLGKMHDIDQSLIQDAARTGVVLDGAPEETKKEPGKKVHTVAGSIIPQLLEEIKDLRSRLDAGKKQPAKRKSTPWMENFEKLRRYHALHGHCGVKKRDDPVLFHFVVNQKTLLREFSGNKRERIDLLNSIDFPWGARHPMSRYLDQLKLKSAIQIEGKAPPNIDEKLEISEAAPDLPLTKKAIAARARETPVLLHPQLNDDHATRPDELSPSQGGDMISFSTWKEREQQAKCSLAGMLKLTAAPGDEEPKELDPEGAPEDPAEDLIQEDDDTCCEQGKDEANGAYHDETTSNSEIQIEHTSMGGGSDVALNDEGKRCLDSSDDASNVAKKPKAAM